MHPQAISGRFGAFKDEALNLMILRTFFLLTDHEINSTNADPVIPLLILIIVILMYMYLKYVHSSPDDYDDRPQAIALCAVKVL